LNAPRSFAVLRALVLLWIGLLAGFAAGAEWLRTRPSPPAPSGGIDLIGAGATFPYPLYRRWFAQYNRETGVRINYFSVGTLEGIRLVFDEEVDFGAIDRPLDAVERARARCGPVEFLTVVGGVAVVSNVPEVSTPLRFDPDVLAGIFLGAITRWDDPALVRLNPGTSLPARPIRVVQRNGASGTGAVFAAYLGESARWRDAGPDENRTWPAGDGVTGNEGIAGQVQATAGSIGFVELTYALQSRLAIAELRNRAGMFVRPTSASIAVAAADLLEQPAGDTLPSLVGARSAAAYPVAAVTRIFVDGVLNDAPRAAHLIAFVRWVLAEGGTAADSLGYAPLPTPALRRQARQLERLRAGQCPSTRTD